MLSIVLTISQVDLGQATNVLDKWISAASRNLTTYVRKVCALLCCAVPCPAVPDELCPALPGELCCAANSCALLCCVALNLMHCALP